MKSRHSASNTFSQYSSLFFLIIPMVLFGINFSLDFFLPRILNNFYHEELKQVGFLLNASFFGSLFVAIWALLYHRNKLELDNPDYYKKLLAISLIITSSGMLALSLSLFIGNAMYMITGRMLMGSGVTLIHVVVFPVLFGINDDERTQALWIFFVTGFYALGRFITYPFILISFNENEKPLTLVILYLIFAVFGLTIAYIARQKALILPGLIKTSTPSRPPAPFQRYDVIMGLIGLMLMGFYEYFFKKRTDFLWSAPGKDPELMMLIVGLAILSGGLTLGRFGASIKLSTLPGYLKNLMLILLSMSILLFITFITLTINISFIDALLNTVASVIFIVAILISRQNIFSLFATVCLGGLIFTLIAFLFLKDTEFEAGALSVGSIFRSLSWPFCIFFILRNYRHSLLSMSGLIIIASNMQQILFFPEYYFKIKMPLENIGYYILLFSYVFYIWIALRNQISTLSPKPESHTVRG